jgi:hypothetical protein
MAFLRPKPDFRIAPLANCWVFLALVPARAAIGVGPPVIPGLPRMIFHKICGVSRPGDC